MFINPIPKMRTISSLYKCTEGGCEPSKNSLLKAGIMTEHNKDEIAQKIIGVRGMLNSTIITLPTVTGRLVDVQIDTKWDLDKAKHEYIPETDSVSFYMHAKRMNRRDYCELFGVSTEVGSVMDFAPVVSFNLTLNELDKLIKTNDINLIKFSTNIFYDGLIFAQMKDVGEYTIGEL